MVAKEQDIALTKRRLAYQARLFDWMGQAAQALAAPARTAAKKLLEKLDQNSWGWGWTAFSAMAALAQTGGIEPQHDHLLTALAEKNVVGKDAWAPVLVQTWFAALPKERQQALGPLPKPVVPKI